MKKRIVEIKNIDNNKKYKEIFSDEIKKIMDIPKMPKCEFFHIGSTSRENSIGELVVDILVVVDNLHEITTFDEKRLNNILYHRVAHDKVKGVIKYARFIDYYELSYDVLLYVVQRDTLVYNQFIEFEKLINSDRNIAEQYNIFKAKYKGNNFIYNDYLIEKTRFIQGVLKRMK